MAILEKKGYGQVEPNHLSAQRTGQIHAQTPVSEDIETLENGSFLKRDVKKNELNATADTEWMLVFNEVKLYDNARQGYKDFRVTAEESVGGIITPRMFKVNIGDIFTTNLVDITAKEAGTKLEIKAGTGEYEHVGILTEAGDDAEGMLFEVIKPFTMPDGQEAVKVHRIQ